MGCASSTPSLHPPVDKAEPTKPHIVMYGMSWCPWCERQLAELERGAALFTYEAHMCDKVRCHERMTTVPTLVLSTANRGARRATRIHGFHTVQQLWDLHSAADK